MRRVFFLGICLLSFTNFTFSADTCACCSNKKVITSASPKPTDTIVTITCSSIGVQWTGQAGQTFVFTAIIKNAATNKVIDTVVKNTGGNSIIIPANPGTAVRWQIEAITTTDGRDFYSYPVRGGKDFIIPACSASIAAAKEKSDALKVSGDQTGKVKVYPNPFHSTLNIQFSGAGSSQKVISLFDINGRTVFTKLTLGNVTEVNVKQLTTGTYIIKIMESNGKMLYTGKVIKE